MRPLKTAQDHQEIHIVAGRGFYRVLRPAVAEWAVCVGDLFHPQTGDRSANASFRNKIDRKHVDFVLCEPETMRPLVGIELDDASHRRAGRVRG